MTEEVLMESDGIMGEGREMVGLLGKTEREVL
jgi:hypothetical protein